VEDYTETIFKVVNQFSKPASLAMIRSKVAEINPGINATTVQMALSMYPRFYESVEGTYGLRVWLSAPHKQTLRTPAAYIESAESFKRIARAQDQGYNVEKMLERDRHGAG
jgi:hypothetical protein